MTAFNDQATWLHTLPLPAQKQSVLILAPPDEAEAVRQVLREIKLHGDEMMVIDDHLMALGHIAHHKPQLVIAHTAAMESEVTATAAALRRMLPDAALLLIGPARQKDTRAAIEAGFDQYLP